MIDPKIFEELERLVKIISTRIDIDATEEFQKILLTHARELIQEAKELQRFKQCAACGMWEKPRVVGLAQKEHYTHGTYECPVEILKRQDLNQAEAKKAERYRSILRMITTVLEGRDSRGAAIGSDTALHFVIEWAQEALKEPE